MSPSDGEPTPPPAPPTARHSAWLLAVLLAPLLLLLGFALLPAIHVPEAVASAIAALWTSGAVLASLTLASRADPPLVGRAALLAAGVSLLVLMAVRGVRAPLDVALVAVALTAAAHALGDGIGRRIAHPGHVAPACAVAAGADIASVIAPEGPTRAIAASDAALSVLAVAGPVPGQPGAIAPTLGLGDLVFAALLLGAAVRHGVTRGRVAGAITVGLVAAFALSALFEAAVPALPAIGAAAVLLVPEFRRVRRADRSAALVGVALALGLAAAALGRRLLAG